MNKKSIIVFIASIIISISVISIYYIDKMRIKAIDKSDIQQNLDENIIFSIDEISEKEGYILINGYALEKGATYEYFNWVCGKGTGVYINNKVVLIDENDNIVGLNTVSEERKDITDSMNDGIDYKKCGVKAIVKKVSLIRKKSIK